MKLLLDEMLKNTAILLRIFGVDAEYFHPRNDTELIEKAANEGRVLITRDKEVYGRCVGKGIPTVLVESVDTEEQLRQVIRELNLKLPFPENTRCPICNVGLKEISREEAALHVPADVLSRPGKFWVCPQCNKAYWEGTHWKNITYIFNKVVGNK